MPLTTPIPAPTLPYWGRISDPSSYGLATNVANREAQIIAAETANGRPYDIDEQFYKWDDTLPGTYLTWTATQGRIPHFNIRAQNRDNTLVPWADIASGAQDAKLAALATAMIAWNVPAFFTFHHEPEGWVCPGGTATSGYDTTQYNGNIAQYVAAWQHVVTYLRGAGVTNLTYVWTVAGYWFIDNTDYRYPPGFYPGNSYVDWVAFDPYNFPSRASDGYVDMTKWADLTALAQWAPAYTWMAATTKPVMLHAFGCRTDPANAGRRAAWFNKARTDLAMTYTAIKALTYYDNNPSFEINNDWRLYPPVTDTAGLAAYQAWGLSLVSHAPVANFTHTNSGLTVSVDGTSSTAVSPATLVTYHWAWGDKHGTTGSTSSHTYTAAGTYNITLTVTDSNGATATSVSSVTVVASVGQASVVSTFDFASWTPSAGTITACLADGDASSLVSSPAAPTASLVACTYAPMLPPRAGLPVSFQLSIDRTGATSGTVNSAKLYSDPTLTTLISTAASQAIPAGSGGSVTTTPLVFTFPAKDIVSMPNWNQPTVVYSITVA